MLRALCDPQQIASPLWAMALLCSVGFRALHGALSLLLRGRVSASSWGGHGMTRARLILPSPAGWPPLSPARAVPEAWDGRAEEREPPALPRRV